MSCFFFLRPSPAIAGRLSLVPHVSPISYPMFSFFYVVLTRGLPSLVGSIYMYLPMQYTT
jgi:hypothetical protein